MASNFLKIVLVAVLVLFGIFYAFFITSEEDPAIILGDDKTFVLTGGTYDTEIHVIITPDIDKAFQFVIEHVNTPVGIEDFEANGVTFTDEEGRMVMWLNSEEDEGVISHELLHATLSIMVWANISLNDTTEEAYAYELQYLTNQFYNKIK